MRRKTPAATAALLLMIVAPVGAAPLTPIRPTPPEMFQTVPRPDSTLAPTSGPRPPRPIVDTMAGRPVAVPAHPAVPTPPLTVVDRPQTAGTGGGGVVGRGAIAGLASWYCLAGSSPCMAGHPDRDGVDAYAAAGPGLRAAICGVQSCASWRGMTVLVDGIPVRLVDWCQCFWRQPHEKLIDLYHDVFFGVDLDGDGTIDTPAAGGEVEVRW